MDTLPSAFHTAHTGYQGLASLQSASNSPAYQQQVQSALAAAHAAAALLAHEPIFSTNEDIDDIHSADLKYLLVPYYEAELLLQLTGPERLDHLASAKSHYLQFFRHCQKLALIHKDDIKTLYKDNKDDPTAQRAALIARTKREKEAKTKLEALQKAMEQSAEVDEELQRSTWLATVECAITNAVRQFESTEKEIKLLEEMANMEQNRDQIVRDSRGNRVNVSQPPPRNAAPVAYTILPGGRRIDLAAQVFKPHFNMATVTPEEAAAAEMKAGRMLKGGGKASEKKKDDSDEDEDADDDAKVQKARAWDDWKDDNPYGSGNSKRS